MFEHRNQPLVPSSVFLRRQARFAGIALAIVAGSLVLGILGYHFLEGLSWIDALVNAAMILGGMGPVDALHTEAGKLFASFYALYAGIVFLVVAGLMVAPMLHRFLHHFHVEMEEASGEK
jgi:hypothetical protein